MIKLRKLPFDAEKNGVISFKTCEFHYGKHHQTYVTNYNNLVAGTEFENAHLLDAILNAKGGIFNNAAQIYNHDFYFDCIAKKSDMSDDFKAVLEANFKDFKAEFLSAATSLFGSGWCWLVYVPENDKLEIVQTSNAATPVSEGKIPLLVADVWEHAYYIDYKNARKDYLDKFYENIDWEFVQSAYLWAKKEKMGSVRFYIDEVHGEKKSNCCCE